MNVVFLGPPGSGKGTQAKHLADDYHLEHLSTGDIFRDAIAHKTPLGEEIKNFVDGGKLVPDELVSRVVFDKLAEFKDGKGFLLDGYPRTLDQAVALDRFAARTGIVISALVFFDVDEAEILRRLAARRTCAKCKHVYNLVDRPPKKDGVCDVCGSELVYRMDDHPEVVHQRLEVYRRQTEPVIEFFRAHSVFRRIDGAQPISKVYSDMSAVMKDLMPESARKI